MWPEADLDRAPVDDFPPLWASAWGDDRFGLWADLVVGGVAQRMRWNEPGTFLMGSTKEQVAALKDKQLHDFAKDEIPQHPVTLTRGFWLADSPCTQAFWLAIEVKNPSRFTEGDEAPQRPVERVNWDAVSQFLGTLRGLLPAGCEPAFPTEAQWEYAARAGTQMAYHWGDDADDSKANWDGKNRGTTPVKRYEPNAWGLYDMHGNVWEWCEGSKREYRDQPEVDPPDGAGSASRALRGGSWSSSAGSARSASRAQLPRGDHWLRTGFRLALRSPSTSPAAGGAGPAERAAVALARSA